LLVFGRRWVLVVALNPAFQADAGEFADRCAILFVTVAGAEFEEEFQVINGLLGGEGLAHLVRLDLRLTRAVMMVVVWLFWRVSQA